MRYLSIPLWRQRQIFLQCIEYKQCGIERIPCVLHDEFFPWETHEFALCGENPSRSGGLPTKWVSNANMLGFLCYAPKQSVEKRSHYICRRNDMIHLLCNWGRGFESHPGWAIFHLIKSIILRTTFQQLKTPGAIALREQHDFVC